MKKICLGFISVFLMVSICHAAPPGSPPSGGARSFTSVAVGGTSNTARFLGTYTVAEVAGLAPSTGDLIVISDGDSACDTTTGGGAYIYILAYNGAAWVCTGDGGAGTVAQLDELTDVSGEGSSGYVLKDDADGTYSFTNITTYEAALEGVMDLQDMQGAVTDAQVPNDITITESDPTALLTAGTDNVKDTHIDWGTGANQVSAADMTADTSNFDGNLGVGDTTVQAALETLDEVAAAGDDMGAVDSLAELNSTITDATLLDAGAISDSTAIGLTTGDTYTNYGAVSDDSLNEMFAAIDTAIGGLAGGHDAVTLSAGIDSNLLSLSTQEIGLDTQTATHVFAGPASGEAAAPAFRALADADIPNDITIDSASAATTAATATNIVVTDNESTAETNAILFTSGGDVDGSTSIGIESDGDLTYNPSTGTLAATVLSTSTQSIADNAVVTVDDAAAAEGDIAVFTANGIEGVTSLSGITLSGGTASTIATWDGSGNLVSNTALGDLAAGGTIIDNAVDNATMADDAVDSAEIADGAIDEAHLNATNAPTDNYVLSYNEAGTNFTWVADAGGAETNSLETTITGIADTEIFVGDGADSGAFVTVSGDATLANTGALSLAADVIAADEMADADHGDVSWTSGVATVEAVSGANAVDSDAYVDDSIDDAHVNWGSGANQVDLADIPGGTAGANVFDFGGATSVEVPNGTNPTTDAAGEIAVDTDDHFIELYSDASRVAVTKYTSQMTIWDPDTIQGTEDAVPMLAVEADWAPHGITIVDCGWKSDAAVTMTIGFEEWTSPTDGSPVTIEDVASGSDVTEQADDGTLADAAVAAGSIVMIDLDTDALNYVQVWFTYFVNPGD